MSLVGSLEDLGLGDILQIVSLSRKSGLLSIHSEEGEGRIVFCDGLVRAAYVKGEPEDLRALLVTSNFLSEDEFQRAAELADARGEPADEIIPENTSLSKERLDALRREHVEKCVFRIFSWKGGEFNFEVRDQIDERDREILMPTGINAQFLTMEATRLDDEGERSEGEPEPVEEEPSISAAHEDPMFSGESTTDEQDFSEVLASQDAREEPLATAIESETDKTSPGDDSSEAHELLALATTRHEVPEIEHEVQSGVELVETSTAVEQQAPTRDLACLIAIDPQLSTLEWQKETLEDLFPRVHIFQSCETGTARIRQYLGRGAIPMVLVSAELPSDAVSGEDGVAGFVKRLKVLAPFMPVLVNLYEGAQEDSPTEAADAVITGPDPAYLKRPAAREELGDVAERFRAEIGHWRKGPIESSQLAEPPATLHSSLPPEDLQRLQELSAQMRNPEMHGDVMSLVLDFAAESSSRVAMFMVREETAIGMAQRGLPSAGGPDDDEFRKLEFPAWETEWFRRVLESGNAARSAPVGDGDHELASRLGGELPSEAYVAPISSGGQVVALLYTDNLPSVDPIGNTAIIEAAVHEAGMALERALLERAGDGAPSEA